jgi:hypothetical protein
LAGRAREGGCEAENRKYQPADPLICVKKPSAAWSNSGEGKKQMIKPKRSAEQQVADELERRALHPLSSRQTISDSQAEPEFHANHKRLRAERLAREAVEIGLKAKK